MIDIDFLEINGFEIHRNRPDNKIVFDPQTSKFLTVNEALEILKKDEPEQYREFELISRLSGKLMDEVEEYYDS